MPRERRREPWLDKRGDRYYAFWYDPAGRRVKRISLGTSGHSEAAAAFATWLKLGTSEYRAAAGPLTCGQALDSYFKEHVLGRSAIDDDDVGEVVDKARIEDAIDNLQRHYGDVLVSNVSLDLQRRYAHLRRTGGIAKLSRSGKPRLAAKGTIRKEQAFLQAAINHAVRHGRLPAVSAPAIWKPKAPAPRTSWLFEDELRKLWDAATARTRDFIDLAYYTGSRARAIETLTKFQVDVKRGRIRLAKADEPVTKKRRPVVPIDVALLPVVTRLMAEGDTEYLLGHPGKIRSGFRWACIKAGMETLPERDGRPAGPLTPHVLRHTRATHLLQAGVDPWAVANLLGDTLTTITRVYGHACPAYLQRAMSARIEGDGQ
jgi:integrase